MFNRRKGLATQTAWRFIGLMATALLLAACAITFVLKLTPTPTQPSPMSIPEPLTPTPEPSIPTPKPTTASSSSGGQSEAVNLDEIFPPGHQMERNLVIYNCSNCHPWVCTVRGQRTVEHWRGVRLIHNKGLFPALSDEDYQILFDFLVENFNDTKPVPDLPEALQDLGCTRPYY